MGRQEGLSKVRNKEWANVYLLSLPRAEYRQNSCTLDGTGTTPWHQV